MDLAFLWLETKFLLIKQKQVIVAYFSLLPVNQTMGILK